MSILRPYEFSLREDQYFFEAKKQVKYRVEIA